MTRVNPTTEEPDRVTVRYFASARAAAGTASETIDVTTVAELRAAVVKRHGPAMARVLPACGLLVDGTSCHDDLTTLTKGAIVDILPPFAGG
jgi:molybdopterin synthase sulfur carrier subunit